MPHAQRIAQPHRPLAATVLADTLEVDGTIYGDNGSKILGLATFYDDLVMGLSNGATANMWHDNFNFPWPYTDVAFEGVEVCLLLC